MSRSSLFLIPALFTGLAVGPALAAPPTQTDQLAAAPTEALTEDEAAAEDDILQTLDLPFVAYELAEVHGLEPVEVEEALESAEEAGVPAAETAEILEGEAEGVKARGKKKGFGRWVARHVAAGERGKVIRELAKARNEEGKELTDEERTKLKAAFKARKKSEKERRERIHAKRKELKAQGKRMKMRGIEKHRERELKMAKMRLKQLKRLEAAGVDSPKLKEKLERAAKRAEKASNREERAEDRRKDARGDHKDAKGELREERAEHKEAREEAKEARKEAREEMGDDAPGAKGKGKGKGKGKLKGKGKGKGKPGQD